MNLFKYKAIPIELAEKFGLCKKYETIWQRIVNFLLNKRIKPVKLSRVELIEKLSEVTLEGYIEATSHELAIIKLTNELKIYPLFIESINSKEIYNSSRLYNLQKFNKYLNMLDRDVYQN